MFAVLGAEYLLRLLPRGTHRYEKFIKPSELARQCRQSGLEIREIIGMTYNPLTKQYSLRLRHERKLHDALPGTGLGCHAEGRLIRSRWHARGHSTGPCVCGQPHARRPRYARLPVAATRAYTSLGARGMLGIGLDIKPESPDYDQSRDEFLRIYADNLCRDTRLFPGMPELLTALETRGVYGALYQQSGALHASLARSAWRDMTGGVRNRRRHDGAYETSSSAPVCCERAHAYRARRLRICRRRPARHSGRSRRWHEGSSRKIRLLEWQ